MFVSYLNNEIRECCLLLGSGRVDSNFSVSEVKVIRALIADLKAAPKLIDSPIKYIYDSEESTINIFHDSFKIICKIISSFDTPKENQIERIKIIDIINLDLQKDSIKKQKSN